MPDDDGDRVARATNGHLSDNQPYVKHNKEKGEYSKVNVFNGSSHFPENKFLVASSHRRSGWVISL